MFASPFEDKQGPAFLVVNLVQTSSFSPNDFLFIYTLILTAGKGRVHKV
jgi:hypothetical protein